MGETLLPEILAFLCFGSRWKLCDLDGAVVKILLSDSEGGGWLYNREKVFKKYDYNQNK